MVTWGNFRVMDEVDADVVELGSGGRRAATGCGILPEGGAGAVVIPRVKK